MLHGIGLINVRVYSKTFTGFIHCNCAAIMGKGVRAKYIVT